jgi:cytochrome c553
MSIIAKALSDVDIADLAGWYSKIKISVELPDLKLDPALRK